MATTTNYGWTTPDDTALVKDGASAIRTLGSSIDTTTKNLNPETTLGDLSFRSSTSNVNTRIPIGSAGQHLTVVAGVPAWATASDQTPLTTKGDLFTFSTVDARVGVGANGTVLTADSSEATGLKWATPATSGFSGVSLSQTSAPTLSNNTDTTLLFDTEVFDTDAYHSTSSDTGNIVIPAGKAGKYLITAAGQFAANSTGRRIINLNFQPGGTKATAEVSATTNAVPTATISFVKDMAVGDYVRLIAWQNSGGSLAMESITFQAVYLGA